MFDTIQPDEDAEMQDTPSCYHRVTGASCRVFAHAAVGAHSAARAGAPGWDTLLQSPAPVGELGPHRPSQLPGDRPGHVVR